MHLTWEQGRDWLQQSLLLTLLSESLNYQLMSMQLINTTLRPQVSSELHNPLAGDNEIDLIDLASEKKQLQAVHAHLRRLNESGTFVGKIFIPGLGSTFHCFPLLHLGDHGPSGGLRKTFGSMRR